ncbi:dnaJ protein ERDJ2B-like [Vigna radiata var. radiata]|uniref:DnaJ protein ERDJ2B-like n=1 Tax=Vigna radiata var. radiata TaxID=3916 RepID=A0A3Q0F041_VIGRR|nr:dnaJ protein ERDJ2B-like [Vigna radiata var. radiata]
MAIPIVSYTITKLYRAASKKAKSIHYQCLNARGLISNVVMESLMMILEASDIFYVVGRLWRGNVDAACGEGVEERCGKIPLCI